MAAVFPNTKKTFSQIVDGTTYMEAVNVNVVYDEVEAVQTFIGAIGSTQANSDSIKNLLANYKFGCGVNWNSAAQLTVAVGELMISDASNNRRLRRITSPITLTWGMIDTGAEANSTQYYVYAIADASGTTFTVQMSTNASTPSGGTFYRKIGTFYNDAGGDIEQVERAEPQFCLPRIYDSGWFLLAAATDYSKTHDLGTTDVQIQTYWAEDAVGTHMQQTNNPQSAADTAWVTAHELNKNTVDVSQGTAFKWIDDDGTLETQSAVGYARIIVKALT